MTAIAQPKSRMIGRNAVFESASLFHGFAVVFPGKRRVHGTRPALLHEWRLMTDALV